MICDHEGACKRHSNVRDEHRGNLMAVIALDATEPRSPYESTCAGERSSGDGRAVREVLDRVGDKWSLLVIVTLQVLCTRGNLRICPSLTSHSCN